MGERRLVSIDIARVVAALALFAYHFVSYRHGLSARPELLAEFGVSLFVAVTGTTLMLRPPSSGLRDYTRLVRARVLRLLPTYWLVAVPVVAAMTLAGLLPAEELRKLPLWLSGLNLFTPDAFLPPVSAWWYVTLALQLIILGPLVARWVHASDSARIVVIAALATGATCLLVGRLPNSYRYLEGALVSAHLLDFVAGALLFKAFVIDRRWRKAPTPVALAVFPLLGPSLPPCLSSGLTVSVLVGLLLGGLLAYEGRLSRVVPQRFAGTTASLALPFFLVHPPILKLAISASPASPWVMAMAVTAAFVVSVAASFALAAMASSVTRRLARRWSRSD